MDLGEQLHTYSRYRMFGDWAKRTLFSSGYLLFSVVVVLLMLALFIWEIILVINDESPHHPAFVTLEVIVNVALLCDVGLRIAAQQRDYFKHWGNNFDCFVVAFSVLIMILLFTFSEHDNIVLGEEIHIVILGLRFFIVFLRTVVIFKNSKSSLNTSKVGFDFLEKSGALEVNDDLFVQPDMHQSQFSYSATSSSSVSAGI
eukprot:TRINITY_DN6965_c0_g1_i1.p1 TRINITY_DN6965_c0_g1~~TRINITY_DN6965_c0_g1_i1.p1  ORF type:complete len:201 (-),score=22.55 TRINITY_DN6965_c0_g1_i1:71-673(-)